MRKKLLGSLAALVAGGGLAWGQSPPQPLPILPPAPTSGAVVPAMAYGYGPGGIQPVGYMPGGMPGSAFVGMAPPGEAIGPPGGMPPGAMPPGAMPQGAMPPGAMPPGAMPGGDMPYGGGMPYPYGGDCYGGADCGTATASAAERMFVKVEYLLWWVKPGPVPIPIITTGSPIGGAIVPASTTQVIFGGDDVNFKGNSGFHVETGCWWDCNHRLGLDLQGFMLEKRSHIASAISDANGFPVIGRPFIEAITGTPSVVNVAFPGFENGLIGATYSTQTWGAEVNAMANLFRSDPCHKCGVVFNLLGGARYMALEETLDITSISSVIGTGPNGVPTQNTIPFGGVLFQAPATVGINDHFYTKTNFYGGQVGFQMEMRRKCITVDLGGKLGVGMVHEILDINGASALAKNGVTAQAVQPGGLLASVTNIGRSSDDRFTLLPECNINLGWQICSGIKASIGYNGLYLQHALRAGDQLNPVVNSTLIPTSQVFGVPFGPLQPQRVFNDSTFWTQGITFSLAFKY